MAACPTQIFDRGRTLADYGVNAIWIGSGSVTRELVEGLKAKSPGLKVFAEFNTMHEAGYLKDHPDARPVGPDGRVAPPPDGWQGVCPTHEGYRRARMEAFRQTLRAAPIDGIWLDYHHAHASWEQARPNLPDTCFCDRCLSRFARETGVALPDGPTAERARRLLGPDRAAWVRWRCGVFTDWVREFRTILDRERPGALLGTFHCPWSESEYGHAMREKLAIDLKAQAPLPGRPEHHDLPRAVRSSGRSGLDLAPDGGPGKTPRHQGRARGTAADLADRAALGLG